MTAAEPLTLWYVSDVLCVWAYAADVKFMEIRRQFGERVKITSHFISVFGDTHKKMELNWGDRGGFAGYSEHVKEITQQMKHIEVHPEVWTRNIPPSSASAHVFLKAIQRLQEQGEITSECLDECDGRTLAEHAAWRMRLAFFKETRNIASLDCQIEIADELGLPTGRIVDFIHSGEAYAALCSDVEMQQQHLIEGSPTYLLNEGRQKLYGNIGYRIIEANIHELLERPGDQASWC